MRLVLMGTGPFAAPTFRDLLDAPQHEVLALYTQPQRGSPAKGRGAPPPSPARQVALDAGLPVEDPESVNAADAVARLQSWNADLLVVCDYGQILKPAALAAARLGGINLHGSLLPKYRGAAPVQWALLNGDRETGVTVIHMTPRLDAGPCLVQQRLAIQEDDDSVTLEARLAQLGIGAVREAIAMLESWDGHTPLGIVQDHREASRAPRFQKADGEVHWQQSAEQIRQQVRGLKPWPGSFTHWLPENGPPVRLILDRVAIVGSHPDAALPGAIVATSAAGVDVMTGNGQVLRIEVLQPAGKRKMTADEFLRGHRCQPGQQLGTPSSNP